jgi:hypothetical protein
MDLLDQPTLLIDAVKHWLAKKNMPTNLDSYQLKQIDAAIRQQSRFSAQTTLEAYLDKISDVIASVLAPKTETRPDRVTADNPEGKVNVGLNPATARVELRDALKTLGYSPAPGERGTIKDLSSDPRLKLVVKTNVQNAQGAGSFIQQNTNPTRVQDYPALELYRLEDKAQPRDWKTRWMLAARDCGDTDAAAALANHGRMVALKSSGIWQALGDGAGGFEDTLNNPFPPFAFNSGMWTRDVDRDTAVKFGLIDADEKAEPAKFDFASLFKEAA